MKTAEEVADKLITVDLLKLETFRDALIRVLTAFAEDRGYEKDKWWSIECLRFRNEALEEAANLADQYGNVGDAIRTLKGKP